MCRLLPEKEVLCVILIDFGVQTVNHTLIWMSLRCVGHESPKRRAMDCQFSDLYLAFSQDMVSIYLRVWLDWSDEVKSTGIQPQVIGL